MRGGRASTGRQRPNGVPSTMPPGGRLPRSSASVAGLRRLERPRSPSCPPGGRSGQLSGSAKRRGPTHLCARPSPARARARSAAARAPHATCARPTGPPGRHLADRRRSRRRAETTSTGCAMRMAGCSAATPPAVGMSGAAPTAVRDGADAPRASHGRACACPWSVRGAPGRHGRQRSAALMRTCGDARRRGHHPRPHPSAHQRPPGRRAMEIVDGILVGDPGEGRSVGSRCQNNGRLAGTPSRRG